MSTKSLEAEIAEAETVVQKSKANQAREGEKFLNRLGMYLDILLTASINSSYQVTRLLLFQTVKQVP